MTTQTYARSPAAIQTVAQPWPLAQQRLCHDVSRGSRGLLALIMLVVVDVACAKDPELPVGTLRLIQATGRGGETDDNLGALLVGQAVCGTHVFIRSEGGDFSQLGGARVRQACIPLTRFRDVSDFELSIYPAKTAAHVHAQLLLDPSACPLQDACATLCASISVPEKPDELDTDSGTCPGSWFALDQASLLVGNILPATSETTTSASSDGTGTTDMTATTMDPSETSSGSTSGTSMPEGTSTTSTSSGTSTGSTT